MYHKLLERQIRRFLKENPEIPEQFQPIFKAISDSYEHYETNNNMLERSIDLSSQELNEANKRVREVNEEIEAKNKDILDSIKYAKRIQDAILPTEHQVDELLSGSFILFQPKDIVSGDFYWMEVQNDQLLLSAVDCTGHGVPGAFMCMIGNSLLNEIVKEKSIVEPGKILDNLRQGVISALKQKGRDGESKDGMDMSLVKINKDKTKLHFAGANNPLYIIRHGELLETKPDKHPIGFHLGDHAPYTEHEIDLQSGDAIYIFTDGYPDQFGGPKGKKFKYNQFKEVLLGIQDLSMKEQGEHLRTRMDEWRGELEQIDDICVFGVKI